MNRIQAIAICLLLACTGLASAQTVYRCVDEDGGLVYADRACRYLGLGRDKPTAAAAESLSATTAFDVEAESGPVQAAEGCPGPDAETLRDNVLAAIGSGNVNALTGMYHWASAGRSASAVIDVMKSLIAAAPQAAELRAPEVNDDWLWAGLPPPTAPAVPELVILPDAQSFDPIARFRLREQAGCLWLSQR
ncbi:MAG: DUF4124 domain-containing protein [Pseudomarimonas sp.]